MSLAVLFSGGGSVSRDQRTLLREAPLRGRRGQRRKALTREANTTHLAPLTENIFKVYSIWKGIGVVCVCVCVYVCMCACAC